MGLPVLATAALALSGAAPAAAEVSPTRQALAADSVFAAYAPAPAVPVGVCLVDTGVNVNPDTETSVVYRGALDGGSGEDLSPTRHGTVLAMMAAAPANGWGIVGVAPSAVRIASVRILEPGQSTFPFTAYAAGITHCVEIRHEYNIRVINLSLGDDEEPSHEDYGHVLDAIERATNYGMAVVAAAGNDDGGPVAFPASAPHVLSVGASDTEGGAFCGFSNRGEGLRLLAPGCDLDGADPLSGEADYNYWQGTSEASIIASSALAALLAYDPTLEASAAEEDLTHAHTGTLDLAQSFRNAGLGEIVTEGEAAEAKPTAPPSGEEAPKQLQPLVSMTYTAPFTRPQAQLLTHHGHTTLDIAGRPSEALLEVRYLARKPHTRALTTIRRITGTFSSLTIPVRGVNEIQLRYIDAYDIQRDSAWTTLNDPAPPHSPQHRSKR